jgi:hypothetical protein
MLCARLWDGRAALMEHRVALLKIGGLGMQMGFGARCQQPELFLNKTIKK